MAAIVPSVPAPPAPREMRVTDGRHYTFAELREISEAFAASKFFRDGHSTQACLTKILAGQELGLPPMQAMTQIMMVDGRPTLAAPNVGALVKRSRRYDYRVVEINDQRCELEFLEHGQPVGKSTFTMADAAKAGLATKQVWRAYPRNMLFSRAMTNGARWYAAEAFNGAIYTPEELGAEVEVLGDGDMRLKNVTHSAPEPPSGGSPFVDEQKAPEPAPPAEAAPPPTMEGLKALFADPRFPHDKRWPTLGRWLVAHIPSCADLQARAEAGGGITPTELAEGARQLEETLKAEYAIEDARQLEETLKAREAFKEHIAAEEPLPAEEEATPAPAPISDEDLEPSTRSQRAQIGIRRDMLIGKGKIVGRGWTTAGYQRFMAATFHGSSKPRTSATQLTVAEARKWLKCLDEVLADKEFPPWPAEPDGPETEAGGDGGMLF
jgi:hypothetical protein